MQKILRHVLLASYLLVSLGFAAQVSRLANMLEPTRKQLILNLILNTHNRQPRKLLYLPVQQIKE